MCSILINIHIHTYVSIINMVVIMIFYDVLDALPPHCGSEQPHEAVPVRLPDGLPPLIATCRQVSWRLLCGFPP